MEVWKHLPLSRRQTAEYPSSVGRSTGTGRQSACFLLPIPFAQQARNSAAVRTRYGRPSVPACRAHRNVASTGSLVRLSTSLGQLLLDFLVPSYAPFRLRFLCCSSWSRRSDSFS